MDFWSAYHRLAPDDKSTKVLLDKFDQQLINNGQKIYALNKQFMTNFNYTDYVSFESLLVDDNDFFDYSVSENIIKRLIGKLKNKSAPHEDGLSVTIFKNISPSLVPALTILFNRSVN